MKKASAATMLALMAAPTNAWTGAPGQPIKLYPLGPADGSGPIYGDLGWFDDSGNLMMRFASLVDFGQIDWMCVHFAKENVVPADNIWYGKIISGNSTVVVRDSYGTCDISKAQADCDGQAGCTDSDNFSSIKTEKYGSSSGNVYWSVSYRPIGG